MLLLRSVLPPLTDYKVQLGEIRRESQGMFLPQIPLTWLRKGR
jgi:hypothetical protein